METSAGQGLLSDVYMCDGGGGGGGLRALMFVPLVHGTAAVCAEACISMGREEGVRVCVRARVLGIH